MFTSLTPNCRINIERIRPMQFSGTNRASGRDSDRPSKKKQPYIPPKAIMVTPDQAEEELKAKADPMTQEYQSCLELIEAQRRRQEHGQDSASRGRVGTVRSDVA
jgi:hypothetical protein